MLEKGVPTREANQRVLSDLLALRVLVKAASKPLSRPDFLAAFVADDQQLIALCGMDMPCASYLSAGLAGLPKVRAEEMIKARKLEADQHDNAREVINIVSSLFNVKDHPHVRLTTFAAIGTPQHTELLHRLDAARARTDQSLTIDRFGAGAMVFAAI